MFSANENLQLRQYKRRIVQYVEQTIPEDKLDLGINVMVMQVSCKAPGCVPLETAIIVVFPDSDVEILDNLPESKGGSYKTKILKPMAEVSQEDVLEALPPAFEGGKRSMEKLCIQARDVMLGQITQLFDEKDIEGRKLMAQYLKESLNEYVNRDCEPPEWGEPFAKAEGNAELNNMQKIEDTPEQSLTPLSSLKTSTGNLVIKRPKPSTTAAPAQSAIASPTVSVNTVTRTRQQQAASAYMEQIRSGDTLSRLMEREHTPGIRRPGCPCCDPDHPSNIADQLMQL